MTPQPAAVLWDFDGTIVDSEGVWLDVLSEMLRESGASVPEDFHRQVVGLSLIDTAAALKHANPAVADPEDDLVVTMVTRVAQRLASTDIAWRPGALELIADLSRHGVPQGVVSASYAEVLNAVLDRMTSGTFAVVVAGDDVVHGKPHPEPYLRACDILGVEPGDALVMEDSPTGVAAAEAAGCLVVAIPDTVALEPGPRRMVIPTLEGLDWPWCVARWQEHHAG